MELIKDLGKEKEGKYNRRYGLFYCTYCDREVKKRIDTGRKMKSCGCLDRRDVILSFETYKCTRCGIVKPLKDYYFNQTGFRRECKNCVKEKQLLFKFNVDYTWYNKKLKEQGHNCAICNTHINEYNHKTNTKFCIDHNHNTGKVRGILCGSCNTAIGLLKEHIPNFKSAISYLRKYNKDIV